LIFFNSRFPSLNIIKEDLNKTSLSANSWLSGFIDSDGHFFCQTSDLIKKQFLVALNRVKLSKIKKTTIKKRLWVY
jgi:hypothetical protein